MKSGFEVSPAAAAGELGRSAADHSDTTRCNMPAATSVAPGRWAGIAVLYDDGSYSVVAGDYDGQHRLSERWNGADNHPGFPSQGGNPLYHVAPEFGQTRW